MIFHSNFDPACWKRFINIIGQLDKLWTLAVQWQRKFSAVNPLGQVTRPNRAILPAMAGFLLKRKRLVSFLKDGYSVICHVKHSEIKICRVAAWAASTLRRQRRNSCRTTTPHGRHRSFTHHILARLIACRRTTIQNTTHFRFAISGARRRPKRPAIAFAIHHRRVADGSARKTDAVTAG